MAEAIEPRQTHTWESYSLFSLHPKLPILHQGVNEQDRYKLVYAGGNKIDVTDAQSRAI